MLQNGKRTTSISAALLTALLMLLAACSPASEETSSGGERTTDLDADEILLTSGLKTLDTCEALLDEIKRDALERVGPYGFDQGGWWGPVPLEQGLEMAGEGDAAASSDGELSTPSVSESSSEPSFTGTNNQETNVDEADLVKTDGERIVVVSNNKIHVLDVETNSLEKTIKLPEEVYGGEIFLDGDRVLLMTTGWTEAVFDESADAALWYPGTNTAKLIEVDLDKGDIVSTLEIEGAYLSARNVDGTMRIVVTAASNRFDFVYPSTPDAEDTAERANRALIEESTIEQWIPTYKIERDGEIVEQGPVVDCSDVHIPAEFAGFGSVIVLTVSLDDGFGLEDSVSVFTDASTVYASTDRLVVATPRWPEFDDEGVADYSDYRSALHTFDIADANATNYVASGAVEGRLLSQYSISEHEGYLRVATTVGEPWSGDSESFVTVLDEDDELLAEVGKVGGLGEGEDIFAVRFLGDKGYVVTFEQIDPLYVINLADPTNPTVEGELKIPGFSTYLHPVDEDTLIAVGRGGDFEGNISGVVLSMFDVSDPTNPTQIDQVPLGPDFSDGNGDSYSPVEYDPRAFNYWDDTALVPVEWWSWNDQPVTDDEFYHEEQQGSALAVVEVNPGDGFRTLGNLEPNIIEQCDEYVSDEYMPTEPDGGIGDNEASEDAEAEFVDSTPDQTAPPTERYCWRYQASINRSVVVDDVVYAISYDGIGIFDFNSLDRLDWISFE